MSFCCLDCSFSCSCWYFWSIFAFPVFDGAGRSIRGRSFGWVAGRELLFSGRAALLSGRNDLLSVREGLFSGRGPGLYGPPASLVFTAPLSLNPPGLGVAATAGAPWLTDAHCCLSVRAVLSC